MAEEKGGCGCGSNKQETSCQGCGSDASGMDTIFAYFCDSCRRSVPEKRCPYCGLKAQRKKGN